MSEKKAPTRPRQITMAVVTSVIGSLLLVLSLFDTLARLRSAETRETVDDFLTGTGRGLGVESSQVLDTMRAMAMISGALAAMLLVFAIFLLQRHKAARIGFTVTAALLLLTVPVTGLLPVLIAVGAVLVWTRPARDWYAGRSPAPVAARPARSLLSDQGPPPSAPYGAPPGASPGGQSGAPTDGPSDGPSDAPSEPRPVADPGPWAYPAVDAPAYPATYPPAYPTGYPSPYPGYPAAGAHPSSPGTADKRPTTVTIAVVLTWIGAGLVAGAMLLFALVLGSGGQRFVDEFNRAAADSGLSFTREQILAVGWTVTVLLLVWSLVAVVLAALAFRRSNAARIMLAVSAVMAALLSLVMILSIISVVPLLMAGAAAVLLFTGGANEWYSRRSGQQPGGYPGYPSYAQYPGSPPHPGHRQQQPGPYPGHAPQQPPQDVTGDQPQDQPQDQLPDRPQQPPPHDQWPPQPPSGRVKPW